ncbi:MAG: tetratricopeptide repeat protein [Gemmatimonadetes bacterium]|nr:tetratricopeptide repeat protein [Gemmatimonadota bacterium]MBM4191220.1 tetratricopeptide repeat protein [Gemmatimonadota bacterium]
MSDFDRLDALRLRFADQPTRFGVSYAEALRRDGRFEDAVVVLRAVLGEVPRNVLCLGILARCLRDLGHLDEAGVVVRAALTLDPDDPVASELSYLLPLAPASAPAPAPETEADAPMPSVFVTQTMAELYVQQGILARAVAIYRELVSRAPDDARLSARLREVIALGERQESSEPERLEDAHAIESAFDFSEDAHRIAPLADVTEESLLAGLSFEAISLPMPAPDGMGLDLPVGTGPSAREVLRQLARQPVASRALRRPPVVPPLRPTARPTATETRPTKHVGSPPRADLTGEDFDQWLRGVS